MTRTAKPAKRGRPALHGKRMRARSVNLPAEAWAALERRARARGVSLAALVRELLAVGSTP